MVLSSTAIGLYQETGKSIMAPITKGGDRSVVKNYRPFSSTSVVGKEIEHVVAGYVSQVWEESDWLYEWQNGFKQGYSCENQIITICQDIEDSLAEAITHRLNSIIIDFSEASSSSH
jgi:hypothetical protein